MRIGIVLLLAVPALAGCFTTSTEDATKDPVDPVSTPWDKPLCDIPLLNERLRMREIDAATDPNDPHHIVVAFIASPPGVRDNAPNDWETWVGVARTLDGGETWEWSLVPGAPMDEQGLLGSDPTGRPVSVLSDPELLFLGDGTFLLSVLGAWPDMRLFVVGYRPGDLVPDFASVVADGGLGEGLSNVPTPPATIYNEKQHLRLDRSTGNILVGWEWYTREIDPLTGEDRFRSDPAFSRSSDGGRTWSDPVRITEADNGLTSGSRFDRDTTIVASTAGLLAYWFDGFTGTAYQATSTDEGKSWSAPEQVGTFEAQRQMVKGVRHSWYLHVAVDETNGPYAGRIHLITSDRSTGDYDFVAMYSDDNGASWSDPVRIHRDELGNGNDQVLFDVALDPDGTLGVFFMDRRHGDGWEMWPYLATSHDGGVTWRETRLGNASSDPRVMSNALTQPPHGEHVTMDRTRVGDFSGLTYTSDGWLAAWQDGRDGTNDVPYSTAYFCRV